MSSQVLELPENKAVKARLGELVGRLVGRSRPSVLSSVKSFMSMDAGGGCYCDGTAAAFAAMLQ